MLLKSVTGQLKKRKFITVRLETNANLFFLHHTTSTLCVRVCACVYESLLTGLSHLIVHFDAFDLCKN